MLKILDSATKVVVALAALGAFGLSWSNSRRIEETKKSVQLVEHTFNSRMEEFIELIKETSKAKGVAQERARQKEQDEPKR